MNISPPILEKFYNQGGDDDGDDHDHEDEQRPYTQWRLATNSDGSPLRVCIQPTDDVTAKEAGVSHGRTLRTYSNTRCMVFGMDTTVLAPTPSPWFSIDSLGEDSLFLGPNYPMMVKGDPAVVDTTLLPFMRSNCIYTLDIAVVPYLVLIYAASAWMISPALLSILTIAGPSQSTYGSKQAFPTPRIG